MKPALTFRLLGTGTSQGVPVVGCTCKVCTSDDYRDKRLRSAAYVTDGNTHLLIDTSPDLRYQLLRSGISDVHAVLMTHEHNDHVAGMDDLRPINFLHHRTIPVYAEKRVGKALRRSFEYIFDKNYHYPGKPRLSLEEISLNPFQVDTIEVIPIRVMHGSLPILGYRFGRIAYLTDVKTIPDEEYSKLKGLDTLVISALHHNPHHSHANLEEALELVERIGPGQSFFMHCSHSMGLFREIDPKLPEGVNLAFDDQIIQS